MTGGATALVSKVCDGRCCVPIEGLVAQLFVVIGRKLSLKDILKVSQAHY